MLTSFIVHRCANDLGICAPAACIIEGIHWSTNSPVLDSAISDIRRLLDTDAEDRLVSEEVEASARIFHDMGHPQTEAAGVRLRRSFRAKGFKRISDIIDAYNIVSARYAAGLGLHDADSMQASSAISVRRARGDERIRPLFREKDIAIPAGDLVYGIDGECFRPVAWIGRKDIDADSFKVTASTRSVLLVALGHACTSHEENRRRCHEVYDLIALNCPGATMRTLETSCLAVR